MNIQQTEKEISTLEVYLKMKVEQSDWKGIVSVASDLCELTAKLSIAKELMPPAILPDPPIAKVDEEVMQMHKLQSPEGFKQSRPNELRPLFVFGEGISRVTLRAMTAPTGNQAVCLHKRYDSNLANDFAHCNNCGLEFGV